VVRVHRDGKGEANTVLEKWERKERSTRTGEAESFSRAYHKPVTADPRTRRGAYRHLLYPYFLYREPPESEESL